MPNFYQDRKWLYNKYWKENLSQYQIAKLCGVCQPTIFNWLKKLNIPHRSLSEAFLGCTRKRTKEHNRKISESHKGKIRSEETKRKISESLTEYWEKIFTLERMNYIENREK